MSGSYGKRDLNVMSSVLVLFMEISLLNNHWTKSFNSWLTMDSIAQSFLAGNKRLVSLAKW